MDAGQSLLEKLEELFGEEPFDQVEEELFKWFMFAYLGDGKEMKNMDSLNFKVFRDKLALLIDAVYEWHQNAV